MLLRYFLETLLLKFGILRHMTLKVTWPKKCEFAVIWEIARDREKRNKFSTLAKNTLGVDGAMFDYLVDRVSHLIERQGTNFWQANCLRERMSVTLKYICQGAYNRLPCNWLRVSMQWESKVVAEMCAAIIKVFKKEVKVSPLSAQVAEDLELLWRTVKLSTQI